MCLGKPQPETRGPLESKLCLRGCPEVSRGLGCPNPTLVRLRAALMEHELPGTPSSVGMMAKQFQRPRVISGGVSGAECGKHNHTEMGRGGAQEKAERDVRGSGWSVACCTYLLFRAEETEAH